VGAVVGRAGYSPAGYAKRRDWCGGGQEGEQRCSGDEPEAIADIGRETVERCSATDKHIAIVESDGCASGLQGASVRRHLRYGRARAERICAETDIHRAIDTYGEFFTDRVWLCMEDTFVDDT